MAGEVGVTWEKIHHWLEKNAPKALVGLNDGAKPEEIKELEELCGVELPEDFKASYEIHDGSTVTLFGGYEFMTVKEIRDYWITTKKVLDENDFNSAYENDDNDGPKKFQNKWWDPKWIAFCHDGCGDHLMIDMAPGEDGVLGQVFYWDNEGCGFDWKASSFVEYLKKFVADLENDKYTVNDEFHHLQPVEYN